MCVRVWRTTWHVVKMGGMGSVSSWSLHWAVGGLARAVEVPGQSVAHTHCTVNQC